MFRTFIQTREFSKNWDKLGFRDEDLRKLELTLLENPDAFPVMQGKLGFRVKMKERVGALVSVMWILLLKRLFI